MNPARLRLPGRILLYGLLLATLACGSGTPGTEPHAGESAGELPATAATVDAARAVDAGTAGTAGGMGGSAQAAAPATAPVPTVQETPPPAISAPVFPAFGPAPRRAREVAPPNIRALAAVVVDGASGAVLYEKDAHTPLPPASTTKIVTALLALERGTLDEQIEVQLDGRSYWGSAMGLVTGDRFTLRDLLYGMMLPSGNDAAYVIAAHIGGSERGFADLMNARMRELGLVENNFLNATGLGRTEHNLISAYDLAQVARYAMTIPEFARIARAQYWTARGSRTIGMRNLNELVFAYPGADGVKIGWGGRSAGHTIVGSAVRNGQRVFVVLLNTPDRAGESAALLNWAFAAYAW